MSLLPKNTLHHWAKYPLTRHVVYSDVSCSTVASKINIYFDEKEQVKPEDLALRFYTYNHALALMANRYDPVEPIANPELVNLIHEYHNLCSDDAIRCIYYLILICVREARHTGWSSHLEALVTSNGGKVMVDFFQTLPSGSTEAQRKFRDDPPAGTMGQLVDAMHTIFYKGAFGSAFGGPAWGAILDCLRAFVHGQFSPEMVLDTVWTLCHNTGPIFNKGMLFHHHHGTKLRMILDVQRSGQIPELVRVGGTYGLSDYISSSLFAHAGVMINTFPDLGTYVDWYKVEGLGAIGSYHTEKLEQQAKYGKSQWADKIDKLKAQAAAAKEKAEADAAAKAKAEAEAEAAEFKKTHLTIMPDVHVKKIEKLRAEAA